MQMECQLIYQTTNTFRTVVENPFQMDCARKCLNTQALIPQS
jgi:hypothetical protein